MQPKNCRVCIRDSHFLCALLVAIWFILAARLGRRYIYLHYLFDLWADVWRKKVAKGDVVVVRYADDLVVGFQHRTDAERFLKEFGERGLKRGPQAPIRRPWALTGL